MSNKQLVSGISAACLMLWLIAETVIAQGVVLGDPSELGFSEQRLTRVVDVVDDAIDDELISGAVMLIARHGQVAMLESRGMADIDDRQPMQSDTLFRIASMTKPVTSVAIMMLYEEGKFFLSDPVAKYLPAFAEMSILDPDKPSQRVPAGVDITIHHLLTHTAGFSYRFLGGSPRLDQIAAIYAESGISDGLSETSGTVTDLVAKLGDSPLMFEPGTEWAYSLSIDVLGRLVEVLSGMSLADFFEERIFAPLQMHDTAFFIDSRQAQARLASVYVPDVRGGLRELHEETVEEEYLSYSASFPYSDPQTYFSGGAGLTSTIGDYYRFLQMLLNGGELDGARLLSPATVAMMTRNNIGELYSSPGVKFGYGFAVIDDPGLAIDAQSRGTYYWGGFFNTRFFVDPSEDLIGIFMSQRRPGDPARLRDRFVGMVYQAIVE